MTKEQKILNILSKKLDNLLSNNYIFIDRTNNEYYHIPFKSSIALDYYGSKCEIKYDYSVKIKNFLFLINIDTLTITVLNTYLLLKELIIYKTFDEWNIDGYIVDKGQKSIKRNIFNKPLFSEYQVKKKNRSYKRNRSNYSDNRFNNTYDYGDLIF